MLATFSSSNPASLGLKSGRHALVRLCLAMLLIVGSALALAASTPEWKVGRVALNLDRDSKGQKVWMMKLSLRNQGKPAAAPVRLLGRWTRATKLKKLSAAELKRLKELGRYRREVALKRTAILKVPLAKLGKPPGAKPAMELVVITGSKVTDHKLIRAR